MLIRWTKNLVVIKPEKGDLTPWTDLPFKVPPDSTVRTHCAGVAVKQYLGSAGLPRQSRQRSYMTMLLVGLLCRLMPSLRAPTGKPLVKR